MTIQWERRTKIIFKQSSAGNFRRESKRCYLSQAKLSEGKMEKEKGTIFEDIMRGWKVVVLDIALGVKGRKKSL